MFPAKTDHKRQCEELGGTFIVITFILQVALVGQEPVLYARSIRENIAYGLESCSLERVQDAARNANAHDFIMQMKSKYETEAGEKGAQLSGNVGFLFLSKAGIAPEMNQNTLHPLGLFTLPDSDSDSNSDCKPNFRTAKSRIQIPIPTAWYRNGIGIRIGISERK